MVQTSSDLAPEAAARNDRNFVTALSRGLKLLELVGAHSKGLSNGELSRLAELPRATVSRLTSTLVQLGYLRVDELSGLYVVTAKMVALSANASQSLDIVQLTGPELLALRDGPNPGVTASLVELVGARVVYRNVVQSVQNNAMWMQAGVLAHALDTAVGRAVLAASEPWQQAQLLEAMKAVDARSEADAERAFKTGLDEYRKNGYCCGFGIWREDVNAIAVPIRIPGAFQVYGISVGGPAIYVTEHELIDVYVPLLMAASQRISALGAAA